jgi:hypothetical protein
MALLEGRRFTTWQLYRQAGGSREMTHGAFFPSLFVLDPPGNPFRYYG